MEKSVYLYLQEEHIEFLRKKMMEEAEMHGFQHPLVLYYSQKIDQEHNRLLGLHAPKDLFPSKIYPTRKNWQIV
ncbi:aspartyl-phosphate phosphatase Spo0E family protein [Salibacterium salarium]|uniref:Aspartyl-phosphate phosphatase Spo0E family protein n=1 Tax=Salibacterium salarium TaxID=284579 RepID=A0A428MS64_9BACI|nr:aspartyl-phosphate phosphatase Spo0E family protein [Salibacterium salarium]RSL29020.1 aspartyl-phosphate phosphatase Spo0E family protein [Salibacterium salarium]